MIPSVSSLFQQIFPVGQNPVMMRKNLVKTGGVTDNGKAFTFDKETHSFQPMCIFALE